jgi:thymidylate synthase (FAD)
MEVLGNGYVNLVDSMGDDLRVINAAKKSFGNTVTVFGEKERKLLKYLWDNKHSSPFEMVEFTFEVKAPLYVIRQWQRHRTWSYNEVSRRYTDQDITFNFPDEWRKQCKNNKQASIGSLDSTLNQMISNEVVTSIHRQMELYNSMIDAGVCREQARMVLPQNMMVEMVAKVDLSNLLKFLKLRNHFHAQREIQVYAQAIGELIEPIVPETMKLYWGIEE